MCNSLYNNFRPNVVVNISVKLVLDIIWHETQRSVKKKNCKTVKFIILCNNKYKILFSLVIYFDFQSTKMLIFSNYSGNLVL